MGNLIPVSQALENSTPTKQGQTLSNDEQRIADSNVGVFVQDASISDLDALLLYCFSVSGLSPSSYPLEADNGVLIDFLLSSFPTFRLQEIRTAFQMNAAGRFGDVIEHYQNFSPVYLGKIMAAFKKKSEDLKKYLESSRSWNKPVEPIRRSDEIPDEIMVELSYANYMKVGKWQFIYPGCYNTLLKYGFKVELEEGIRQRKIFNSLSENTKKTHIPEDKETQFRKWLVAYIFEQQKQAGRKEFKL